MKKTTVQKTIMAFCAVALVFSLYIVGQAQQQSGGQPPAGQGAAAPQKKVLVAGENPAIRKLDKEGGTAVTNANFFRVFWSPVGNGTVCYFEVKGQGAGKDMRIAFTDNPKIFDYVTKDLMSSLLPTFNKPEYTVVPATITHSGDGIVEYKETIKSKDYTIELIWKNVSTSGQWADMTMRGANPVQMNFVMLEAAGGEITINGKPAPGTWYAKGGGMGSGAYLTLNETWMR